MNSRLPSLSFVKNVLSNSFASTRSVEDLEIVYDYVTTHTEIEHDRLWSLLSRAQRLQLCAYFRYDHVKSASSIDLSDVNLGSKLMIFVKGKGNIVCGNHCLQLQQNLGPCLGVIPLAPQYRTLLDHTEMTSGKCPIGVKGMNTYQKFMQVMSKDDEVSIGNTGSHLFLQERSGFISLNHLDTQMFLERFFDRQVSLRVLRRFKCHGMIKPRFDFLSFPKDHPVVIEGSCNGKILLTIRGKCALNVNLQTKPNLRVADKSFTPQVPHHCTSTDSTEQQTVNICQVKPLSFLAFQPHFFDEMNHNIVSVTALTRVQVLVLDAKEFKECISACPSVRDAFEHLARLQIQWLKNDFPKFLKKELDLDDSSEESHELIEDFPTSSIGDIENLIQTRTKKCPRTNKCKVLHEFKRLVIGDVDHDDNSEFEDLFLRFGLDDEGLQDLLQNTDSKDVDSEEFNLMPFPSILISRKRYGKTLPNVAQSDGYLNPFDLMEA